MNLRRSSIAEKIKLKIMRTLDLIKGIASLLPVS